MKICVVRPLPISYLSEECLYLVYFTIKKHTRGMAVWHGRLWKIDYKSHISHLHPDYLSLRGLSSTGPADFIAYWGIDFGDLWLSFS